MVQKINQFRDKHPQRTCTKHYSQYQHYKDNLRVDFNYRCGYTDCPEDWFGGRNNFHIDHFIPWRKHPNNNKIKTDYQNLVYCCSYVNILKSDDEGAYLDPCNHDFNYHFCRDSRGNIIPNPKSAKAKYMHDQMKLYLARYGIIWMLSQLDAKIDEIQQIIESSQNKDDSNNAKIQAYDLMMEFHKYRKYLSKEL